MGCLFRCVWFRGNGEEGRRKHLVASSLPSPSKESVATRRQLGSIFLDYEMDSLPEQGISTTAKNNLGTDSLFRELKREAEFLKACGAILETPTEIRKTSGALTTRDPGEDGGSSGHISRFAGRSCKMKLWDEKEEPSRSPVHVQENGDAASQDNQESCTFKVHRSPQDCECSLPSVNLSKSVSFESLQNQSSIESIDTGTPDISPSKHEFQIHSFASECSPFPTPLRVTTDMETPATSCQSSLEHDRTGNGRNTKIRIHYVYPVRNHAESPSQWKVLNEDSFRPVQLYDIFSQQNNHRHDTSEAEGWELSCTSGLTSLSSKGRQQDEAVYVDKYVSDRTLSRLERCNPRDTTLSSPKNSEQTVTRLPQWSEAPGENDGLRNEINSSEKPHSAKSTVTERPILGMVAANWKDEETKPRSLKRWDGNGIPNSTNKYKEDQKVSWRATPSEERPEKALSDEKFLTTKVSFSMESQWSWRKKVI